MDADGDPAFVRHAFAEQKTLSLPWYSNIRDGVSKLEKLTMNTLSHPLSIREALQKMFVGQWEEDRNINRKLGFYNSIKKSFSCEDYLQVKLTYKQLKKLAQLRTSSHRLNIEKGRHGSLRQGNILNRLCYQCCDEDMVKLLAELPFFDPILEDEVHVLQQCPLYSDLRESLSDAAKACLSHDLTTLFDDQQFTRWKWQRWSQR